MVTAIDELGRVLSPERFGHLDILIGNAAELGPLSPLAHMSIRKLSSALSRSTGHHQLSPDSLLRPAPARIPLPARAVFVTADVGSEDSEGYFGEAMPRAKQRWKSLVMTYAAETATTNVRVNLVDPGPMRTRLRAKAFPGEDKEALALPKDRTDIFVDLAEACDTRRGQRIEAH